MFEFLFNYPAAALSAGRIELAAPWWVYAGLVTFAAFLLPSVCLYFKVGAESTAGDRRLLTGLRTAVVATVLFSLFQPLLVVPLATEENSVVAVLIDDSRSMRIADQNGERRSEFVQAQLSAEGGTLRNALSERFDLQLYRFGATADRIDDLGELTFSAGGTDLGRALSQVREELSGLPLAGMVVISDGAHNAGQRLKLSLPRLRAGGVPVHTVGVGRETYRKDLEVGPVEVPASVLRDSNLVVSVPVRSRGFEGMKIAVIAEDDGRILDTQEVEVHESEATALARLSLKLSEPGLRRLRIRVPTQRGETLAENNHREFLVEVRNRAERILHFEGEPRFEVKFLRRALSDDPNLEIVSLIQTAENKYYRLGLDSPQELARGFPSDPRELFSYRALVLGSVEASHFSTEQLDMIAEFVSERGGGLLLLGGRRAFAEGGYHETVLADVSPMLLEPRGGPIVPLPARVRSTPQGLEHPVTRREQATDAGAWSTLPALTVVNPIHRLKLGAIPLLWAAGPDNSEPLQILAVQRYGRGRVAAFAVRNSWQWKMHPDVAPDDRTHELFWRQLLRWLVQSTPDRLKFTLPRDVAPNEAVAVKADLRDSAFRPDSGAAPTLRVRSPSGVEETLVMVPHATESGGFESQFVARESGLYDLRAEVAAGADEVVQTTGHVRADPGVREFHDAELNARLLARVAAQTGGRFYPADQAGSLARELVPANSGTETLRRLELWNMPALLLLVVLLLAVEWFYRRWRGLV